MTQDYTILYGVLTAFYALIAIATIIGAIIYTSKKKNLAGILMVIGSVFQFFSSIASPIANAISARSGSENILISNFIVSAIGALFSLVFVIGFILAMLDIRKKNPNKQ